MASQEETLSVLPVLDTKQILGGGDRGNVFKATWTVAVKRIELRNVKGKKEEEALKKLSHPNVVKLFDVYSDNDFRFYALELCHASMDQLFHGNEIQKNYREKMPPEEEVCLQLAKGLAYIHENRLIHRDLKPYNVLIQVDSNGKVLMKWADFEDCLPVDENGCYSIPIGTDPHELLNVGTDNWRPPELLEIITGITQKTQGTVKSDVFSQGLVFGYYILGGRHPYPKEDYTINKHILDSNPAILNTIQNPRMYEIIMKMLEKDPEKRISSADVVTEITNIGN